MTAQSGAFPGCEVLHRTVTRSQARQDRSSVLRICVYLCPSVVFLCIVTAKRALRGWERIEFRAPGRRVACLCDTPVSTAFGSVTGTKFRLGETTTNMKRAIRAVALCAAVVLAPQPGRAGTVWLSGKTANASPQTIKVFLLGGQSNADGRAKTSDLPSNLSSPQADVPLYYYARGMTANADGTLGKLVTLRPGCSYYTSAFGPEITFGRAMADYYAQTNHIPTNEVMVAIIKYAYGGTGLYDSWLPNNNSGTNGDGPQYVTFQNVVGAGLAKLSATYPGANIELHGMLWVQGEQDVEHAPGDPTYPIAYRTNLVNFIKDVRMTYAGRQPYGTNLPFLYSRISVNQGWYSDPASTNYSNYQILRTNQPYAAATLSNAFMLDTDPPQFSTANPVNGIFTLSNGDVVSQHFDSGGQRSLGAAFAQVASSLVTGAPQITDGPHSQTASAGTAAAFSATAVGAAPLSYQWQFNGTNISGASVSSYTVSNAQTTNAGSYRVVVTNTYGSVTSATAVLTVVVPGATKFWDVNGTVAGPGGTSPAGVWGTSTSNWNTDSTGGAGGTVSAWAANSDAVFSAGTAATGTFTVTIASGTTQYVNSVTIEEGTITFGQAYVAVTGATGTGGTALFNVLAGASASFSGSGAGYLCGSAGLNKQGGGALWMGSTEYYTGNTYIDGGICYLKTYSGSTPKTPFGGNGTSTIYLQNGAGVVASQPTSGSVLLPSGYTVSLGNVGGGVLAAMDGYTLDVSARITGSGPLTVASNLVVLRATTSDYSGNTIISAGTLRLGAAGVIPDGSGKGNLVLNGGSTAGILDLQGYSETINGLAGVSGAVPGQVVNDAAGTTSTLTVGAGNTSSAFAGSLKNNTGTGGTLALVKTGTGTLTLSGASSYSGGTTVGSGTLALASTGSLMGDIMVASGGVLTVSNAAALAATGTVAFASSPPNSVANLNFSGAANTIKALSFDGGVNFLAAGTWGASSSTAAHKNDSHFTGTGSLNVTMDGTVVTVASSLNPAAYGQSVTFTGTVAAASIGGTPTGTVTFKNGSSALGAAPLDGTGRATFTTTLPTNGTYSVTAAYGGDGVTYAPGTSTALSQVVNGVIYSQTNAILSVTNNRDGTFGLTFLGTPQAQYCVVASPDVSRPMSAWTPLVGSTNTASSPGGLWSFTVSNAAPCSYRSKAVNTP
jgi:autotransporter-associated beta strand protein